MVYYFTFSFNVFLFFLAATISLGRSFSVLGIPTRWLPVYATEIALILLSPFIIRNLSAIREWPRSFKVSFVAFIFLSSFYLDAALFSNNLYAFRDIVYNLYTAFIFLGFFFVVTIFRIRELNLFMILINLIAVLLARDFFINGYYLNRAFDFKLVELFLQNLRAVHIGLFCGIFLAFYLARFSYLQKTKHKAAIFLLMFINSYMILTTGERSLWLMFVFLLIISLAIGERSYLRQRIIVWAALISMTFGSFIFLDKTFHRTERMEFVTLKMRYLLGESRPLGKKQPIIEQQMQEERGEEFLPVAAITTEDHPQNLKGNLTAKDYEDFASSELKGEVLSSYQWRWDVLRSSIAFGLEKPLFGQGFGKIPNYRIFGSDPPPISVMHPKANSGVIPAHNHIVTIFYKMGIVGLILFLSMNGLILFYGFNVLKNSCPEDRWIIEGLISAFLIWHFIALFFDVIDCPTTNIFLWLIMGGILKLYVQYKKNGNLKKNAA